MDLTTIPIWAVILILLAVLVTYSWMILHHEAIETSKENYYISEQERWYALWPAIARLPEKHRIRICNAVNLVRYKEEMEMKLEAVTKESSDVKPVSSLPRSHGG